MTNATTPAALESSVEVRTAQNENLHNYTRVDHAVKRISDEILALFASENPGKTISTRSLSHTALRNNDGTLDISVSMVLAAT